MVTDSTRRLDVHGVVMDVVPDAESGLEDFLDFALYFAVLHGVLIISPLQTRLQHNQKIANRAKRR